MFVITLNATVQYVMLINNTRPVLLTATTLSNVRPIYRVGQHFHYTVMIIDLLILVKHNYLILYRIALIKTHNAQPNY